MWWTWCSVALAQSVDVPLGALEFPPDGSGLQALWMPPAVYAQFAAAKGAPAELLEVPRAAGYGAVHFDRWVRYALFEKKGAYRIVTEDGEAALTGDETWVEGVVGDLKFGLVVAQGQLIAMGRTYRAGELAIGDQRHRVATDDLDGDGPLPTTVLVDCDGDGALEHSGNESARLGEVLMIADQAWVVSAPEPGLLRLEPTTERPAVQVGQAPPPLTGPDLDGVVQVLGEPRDGPVLLDFWGTWCVGCIQAFPKLAEAQAEGITIVGVAVNDPLPAVKAFAQERGMAWPTVVVGKGEASREVIAQWGLHSFPTYAVLDAEGRLRHHSGDLERAKEAYRALGRP